LEVKAGLLIFTTVIALPYGLVNTLVSLEHVYYSELSNFIFYNLNLFLLPLLFFVLTILQVIWILLHYNNMATIEEEFRSSYLLRTIQMARFAFLKKSIGVQMLILLIVIFFWGAGTMLLFTVPEVMIIWVPATLFIGIPVLLFMMKRFGYLNILM